MGFETARKRGAEEGLMRFCFCVKLEGGSCGHGSDDLQD